jgi:outer membrane biosynthesis protein TonB
MKKLNLKTTNEPQKRIKEYLEQSASDVLADKINYGTEIEKDGKTLVNKKTLDGFMKYATEEARKIAEKGSQYACVDDATVFGWATHYFEEDSIEEKLYNEDGTEYQAPKPKASAPKKPTKKPDVKKPEPKPTPKPTEPPKKIIAFDQVSLFDF